MPAIHLPPGVDPAGLPRAPQAPQVFDPSPHRNVGMPARYTEFETVPDDLLIATAVALGMPRFAAEQCRVQPTLRWSLAVVWADVQDADEGDRLAKEKVDYYRAMWAEMRRMELIADKPDHTIGLFER